MCSIPYVYFGPCILMGYIPICIGISYAYGLIICLQDGLSKLYIYPGDLACSWIKEHLNQRKLAIARTVTMHAAQSELTCY